MAEIKYTVFGFQQDKLVMANINCNEALLLRELKDMFANVKMEHTINENKSYVWIHQTALSDRLPILGQKRNLRRMLKKLELEQYITRIVKKSKNGIPGSYSYIRPTEKLQDLEEKSCTTEEQMDLPPRNKWTPPLGTNGPNKDSSSSYPLEEDANNNIVASKEATTFEQKEPNEKIIFNYYMSKDNLINHKRLTESMTKSLKKALKSYTVDELKEVIDRHSEVVKITKDSHYPVKRRGLDVLFGQKKDNNAGSPLLYEEYIDGGDKYETHLKTKKQAPKKNFFGEVVDNNNKNSKKNFFGETI